MRSIDEIVEVRVAREAYAARFDYDLAKIYDDFKAKEQARTSIANLRFLQPNPTMPRFSQSGVAVNESRRESYRRRMRSNDEILFARRITPSDLNRLSLMS
jgi:hypothetical protein